MDTEKNYEETINNFSERPPLDLTFISNEPSKTLKDRFEQLIKDCRFFDCLVAYFYISGFHAIYKPLQNTEKIRILIGISTTKETYDVIKNAEENLFQSLQYSHSETKEMIENEIENEMSSSEDSQSIEEGTLKFIEWIREGKLQIKLIHLKIFMQSYTF